MLEALVAFLAERVAGDEQLDPAARVLQGGEARLAHDALEHHPPGDRDRHLLRLQRLVLEVAVAAGELEGPVARFEVVREGDAAGADRRELGAAFGDEGVVVVHKSLWEHKNCRRSPAAARIDGARAGRHLESRANESHRHRHRLRRPRHRRLPGRSRQRGVLPRPRPAQDRAARGRPHSDLRAGPRGARSPQPQRRPADLLDRRRRQRSPRRDPVHRRRHARRRGRLGRPQPRARGGAQHRPAHGGLQGRRRQVDGAGGHGRQGAGGHRGGAATRAAAPRRVAHRRLQSRVPEGRRGGRGLHAARPDRHRRRRRRARPARPAGDEDALRAVQPAPRPHPGHGRALGRVHQVRRQRDARHPDLVHERDGQPRRQGRRRHRIGAPRHRLRPAHRLRLPLCRHRLRRLVLPQGREGAAPHGRGARHAR